MTAPLSDEQVEQLNAIGVVGAREQDGGMAARDWFDGVTPALR